MRIATMGTPGTLRRGRRSTPIRTDEGKPSGRRRALVLVACSLGAWALVAFAVWAAL